MQVAGLTNDHLIGCFRFQECIAAAEGKEENGIKDKTEETNPDNVMESELSIAIEEMNFSSEWWKPNDLRWWQVELQAQSSPCWHIHSHSYTG